MMDGEVDKFVAMLHVWTQVSGNYDAERRTRTLVVSPATTIADIMAWVATQSKGSLGVGDVIITKHQP